jgi:hypothetical protein
MENFKNKILLPGEEGSSLHYLGPMGNPVPIEFINLETNWLLYKHSPMDLANCTGWRNWYMRTANSQRDFWDEKDIDQCITFSFANKERMRISS